MLGKRKKVNKEETHQKRKWELEFAEGENDSKIENYSLDIKEIPKLVDSDDEKQIVIGEVSDKDIKDAQNEAQQNDLNVFGEKKKKIYEWMDSSDENEKSKKSLCDEDDEEEEINKKTQHGTKKNKDSQLNVLNNEAFAQEDRDSRTIFVNNLSFDMSSKEIENIFKKYGKIINMDIPKNEGAIFNKGRAFLEYSKIKEAKNALESNNSWIKGRQIQCTLGIINATSQALEDKKNKPKIAQIIMPNKHRKIKRGSSSSESNHRLKAKKKTSSSRSRSRSKSKSLKGKHKK